MKQTLAAVALAVVIYSLVQECSLTCALLSAGALACICGGFVIEFSLPTATTSAGSWLAAPKQILSFSALFLASLASRWGASESISHLALTALFWQLSISKHNRRGVLALVAAIHVMQTALICGVHVLCHPGGADSYMFAIRAVFVGILAPASWFLPGVHGLVRAATAAAALPPADAAFPEALRRINEPGEAPEDCSCPHVVTGSSGQWHPHPGVAAAAAAPAAPPATAAMGREGGRGARSPKPDASSLRPCSDDPLDAPVGLTATDACSSWSAPASRGTPCDSDVPEPVGPGSLGAGTTSIACQTDDELLLWLFTRGSATPSAMDEVHDESRASYSGGHASPNSHAAQLAEPWGSTAKDGSAVSSFADGGSRGGGWGGFRGSGGDGCHEGRSGDDGGRSGGVGKFDSFTSVWSRCAGGGYGKERSGRVSIDVVEVPLPAPGRALEEGRLSNGSQQGAKAGGQATGGQAAAWLPPHALPASKHREAALAPVAMPAPAQPRGTSEGTRGCGVGGVGLSSPAGPPAGGDLVQHQHQNHSKQQLQSQLQAVHTQLPHQSSPPWRAGPAPPHAAVPHHQLPSTRLSPRAQQPRASVRRYSGFDGAGGSRSAPAAVAAAAAALGVTAAAATPRPLVAYDCQVSQAAAELPAAAPGEGASAAAASGAGMGSPGAVASRSALARRQRLQRSRTFNVLSPERSRVLVGLAATDGGSPLHLPPPELDEQRLGSLPVAVPSPYSEESEDESMQQFRVLRALRRSHPELAICLDRSAALLRRLDTDNAALTTTAGPVNALIRTPQSPAAVAAVAAAAPPDGGMGRSAGAGPSGGPGSGRAGGRRAAVRRTQSFSSAALGRGTEETPQHEPLLRPMYITHQQLLLLRQQQQQQQQQQQAQAQGALPRAGHLLPRARAADGAGTRPSELGMAAAAAAQLVHAGEPPTTSPAPQTAVLAPAAVGGVMTTDSGGLTVAGGAWELPHDHQSGDSQRESAGAWTERRGSGGGGAGAAAAATCAAAAAPAHSPECGRRAHHVQRSRSAGETRFRSGSGIFPGVRRHWSQLPHQEHRRASLMQAWQAMLAAEQLTAAGAPGAAPSESLAAAATLSPLTLGGRFLDSDSALPYGADPYGPLAADVASVRVAGAAGHSPTSPPTGPVAAVAAAGIIKPSSGDGSGSPAVHSARGAPGAAADPAVDDRSVRLCKSLSERSLQQRLAANHHFRRVARTKSRFALLQQDSSDGSVGGASSLGGSSLPRISSGGSMASRTLENVLEEQEEEQEEGVAAAAAAVVGSARGALAGRHSPSREVRVGSPPAKPASPLASRSAGALDAGRGGDSRSLGLGGGKSGAASAADRADTAFTATGADGTAAADAAAVAMAASDGNVVQAAGADVASFSPVGAVSGSPPHRRIAWRSASELSFAVGRTHATGPGGGVLERSSSLEVGGGGGSDAGGDSPRWLISGCCSSGSQADRRSLDSAVLARGTVESWLHDGNDSIPSRTAASVASVDGPASLPRRPRGSNGSGDEPNGAAAADAAGTGEGASVRLSGSGIAHVGSLMGLARESERLSLAHGGSAQLGGGGGSSAGDPHGSGSGRGEAGGEGDGADSDEELLDVLADEALQCGPALQRLREQSSPPGKTASFRFYAPIVPPSVPLPSPPAAPAAPGVASPYSLVAGLQGASEPAGGAPAAAAAAASAAGVAGVHCDDGVDDIPVPLLAEPVLPEIERERERSRERPAGHWPPPSASDAASATTSGSAPASHPCPGPGAAGSPPATGAPGAALAAAGATAAAPGPLAPLSAQNLHNHTRHWEAASPDASDPAALALQLPSPSPSQSGPIDPLSDGDGAPSPALLAALTAAAAAAPATAVPGAIGGGGGGSSSRCSSPPSNSAVGGLGDVGQVPRAVLTARLSVPVLPYSGPDTTALVLAAGRNSTASGLSRQASEHTVSGLSVCESGASLFDASAAATAALMRSADDAVAAAALATSAAAQPHLAQRSSVVSRGPSVLISGSNAGGRNLVLRMNSGGGANGAVPLSGGSGATGLHPRPNAAPSSVRQPSKLSAGAALSGGEAVEAEVEEAVLANRRIQDERGVLLEEIQIDKVLGFGSMGMVYYGRLYDTKVVVKLIEHGTGVLGKEKERGRLARVEACVSRMLLHPNVVLTYDACTGNLQPGRLAAKLGRGGGMGGGGGRGGGRQRFMTVMVQEFCELGTLKDALGKRKHGLAAWAGHSSSASSAAAEGLPLLYRVALDIANGMKHLAALRIIHADLKAENVLLQKVDASSDRPHGFTAKVADFGLAMVLAPGSDEIRQGIHGTVSHMPPEAMQDTCFSLATDVFSFGVVLWELYTTESPYRGMAPHEVVEAVCARGERPPWPPSSPPDLVALAEDCWHPDPHHRPSFADVVERLRQLLAPTQGPPERSSSLLSGMTEESDELEMALRQQRKGAPAPSVRGGGGGGGGASGGGDLSETGPDFAAAGSGGRHGGRATGGSSHGGGGGEDGVGGVGLPRVAPRDPLGLLLWALCQFPGEAPRRVAGPSPDSEQWVLQVEDIVLKSRQLEHEEAGAGAAAATAAPGAAGWSAAESTPGAAAAAVAE